MNNLLNYLPPVIYEENKEVQEITKTELPEIDSLWNSIEKVRNSQFITTSDSNRIRLWERLLKIRPDFSTQDLDYRKDMVLLRLGLTPPFTYKWLETLLTDRVGEGNFTISLDHNNYEIDVRITHKDVNIINELRAFIREILPANIVTITRRVQVKEVKPIKIIPVVFSRTQNKHIHKALERPTRQSKVNIKTGILTLSRNIHIHRAMERPKI